MVWTLIEPGVAIVASSLVTIRPLLRLWRIKGFGTTGQSRPTGAVANSHAISRTNRSGKMPGFGSTDVTVVDDVELGQPSGPKSRLSFTGAFSGHIQRSLSLSDAKSFRSRASSDAPILASHLKRSRSISDADTLAARSHQSRPSHMSKVFEAPMEDDYDAQFEYNDGFPRRAEVLSEVLSETYVIEGNVTPIPPTPPLGVLRRGDTWLSEQGSSNDGSSLEVNRIRSSFVNARDSFRLTKPLPQLPSHHQR